MEEWRHRSTILGLGNAWRWVVSFVSLLALPLWKQSPVPLDRRLGGPRTGLGAVPGIEPRPSSLIQNALLLRNLYFFLLHSVQYYINILVIIFQRLCFHFFFFAFMPVLFLIREMSASTVRNKIMWAKQNILCAFLSHAYYLHGPSNPSWHDDPCLTRSVYYKAPDYVVFASLLLRLPIRSKHFPKRPLLKYPHSMSS
jgi:hypothetical protein